MRGGMSQASKRTQMLAKFWWQTWNKSDYFEDIHGQQCDIIILKLLEILGGHKDSWTDQDYYTGTVGFTDSKVTS
jgi:hypothetical protein